MGRRTLNRLVGQMRREQARAAAPVAPQRADMPFERLSIAQLDQAGAALLLPAEPDEEEAPSCAYCGDRLVGNLSDNYCSPRCVAQAAGEGND